METQYHKEWEIIKEIQMGKWQKVDLCFGKRSQYELPAE